MKKIAAHMDALFSRTLRFMKMHTAHEMTIMWPTPKSAVMPQNSTM